MTKNMFVGVNGVARKQINMYVGVNDVARKVKAAYIGVDGIARQCWPYSLIPDDDYQELAWSGIGLYTGIKTSVQPRIEIEFDITGGYTDSNYNPFLIYAQAASDRDDNNDYIPDYRLIYSAYVSLWNNPNATSLRRFLFRYTSNLNDFEAQSNAIEGVLFDKRYKLDYNLLTSKIYLYCENGYYSNASNNLILSYTKNTTPASMYDAYDDDIAIGGDPSRSVHDWDFASRRFYSIKLSDSSNTLFQGVPCYRKSDGLIGWYDLVNRYFIRGADGNHTTKYYSEYIGLLVPIDDENIAPPKED